MMPTYSAFARSAVICLFLTTATPGWAAAQSSPSAPRAEVDVPAGVEALLRSYEEGWAARDAQSLSRLFVEDGWALRPGASLVQGRDAIQGTYAGLGGPLVLRAYHFEARDDLGVLVGGFARYADEPDLGKFVLALRRIEPGTWRIIADIDNGN